MIVFVEAVMLIFYYFPCHDGININLNLDISEDNCIFKLRGRKHTPVKSCSQSLFKMVLESQ